MESVCVCFKESECVSVVWLSQEAYKKDLQKRPINETYKRCPKATHCNTLQHTATYCVVCLCVCLERPTKETYKRDL